MPSASLWRPMGGASRQKLSPEVAFVRFFEQKTNKKHNWDEYFGGKRNAASRALWTD
ncbi:hypothetical protein [Marinilabilia salmonicolor]|uniref:hypothetical protein n=1 Tax=Marinilabilia salmonicolor TaxID=989 RepID=UPI00131F2CF4|nr:hypothetical protein [Marinilabilia salmonicolor]